MWYRNLFFIGSLLVGLGAVSGGLLQPNRLEKRLAATVIPEPGEIRSIVDAVDKEFEEYWQG